MKRILVFLWILLAMSVPAPAAVTPQRVVAAENEKASIQPAVKKYTRFLAYGHKHPKLQQLVLKLTQKKWFQKWMAKVDDRQRTKNIMGTIALISGILVVLSIFTVPVAAVLLVPAAVVTGIIGVTKNPNRKSYTFALIGLILGILYLALLAVLLAFAIAWSNGW